MAIARLPRRLIKSFFSPLKLRSSENHRPAPFNVTCCRLSRSNRMTRVTSKRASSRQQRDDIIRDLVADV